MKYSAAQFRNHGFKPLVHRRLTYSTAQFLKRDAGISCVSVAVFSELKKPTFVGSMKTKKNTTDARAAMNELTELEHSLHCNMTVTTPTNINPLRLVYASIKNLAQYYKVYKFSI